MKYQPEAEISVNIKGLSCATGAEALERQLKRQSGVKEALVSFTLGKATLKYHPELIAPATIKGLISSSGYTVEEDDRRPTAGRAGFALLAKHLETIRMVIVGCLLALGWILAKLLPMPIVLIDLMLPLAIIIGGYSIAINAIKGLLQQRLNVDLLVIIAASAAVAIGDYLEAGLVIFILLLGEFLETMTVARTGKAIKGLASLIPDTVKLKRGEQEIEAPPSAIKVDDIIVVRPGEHIAIDGIIVKGQATINQALITGESIPVDKSAGDEVYAGTINNMGAIEIKATKVGRDTTVAKIEKMIAESQARRAPVERTVDRFAGYFVPAVLVFAALVYLVTLDLRRAITVLIVACPCALVLGTPTAVVAAIGSAARRGILIKGGEALEAAGRVRSFIFDKTGTLTWGKPKVLSIRGVGSCAHEESSIIGLAATAESFSEHPLAGAIMEKAREHEIVIIAPDDFKVKTGTGVEVRQNGLHIIVGNREMLKANDLELSRELHDYIDVKEEQGATVLIIVHGKEQCNNNVATQADGNICCPKEICGVLELVDPPRVESAQAISLLKAAGAKIIALYTGDNPRSAATIAERVGIDKVIAMLSPADKANRIKELKEQGQLIAMVGDGVNDAPALAAADLGVAMGVIGSDITVSAANVVILDDDILSVPRVTALGRKTLEIIKQNIAFALLFNLTMMGLAAYGIIGMVVAAVFHQASSLMVILNSMRLLRWEKSF